MVKVKGAVSGYHPATGLDLVRGKELEVTDEQAEALVAAGLATAEKRASKPEEK